MPTPQHAHAARAPHVGSRSGRNTARVCARKTVGRWGIRTPVSGFSLRHADHCTNPPLLLPRKALSTNTYIRWRPLASTAREGRARGWRAGSQEKATKRCDFYWVCPVLRAPKATGGLRPRRPRRMASASRRRIHLRTVGAADHEREASASWRSAPTAYACCVRDHCA